MKRSVIIIFLLVTFISSALTQQIEITGIGIAPDVFVELTYNQIATKNRYAYLNVPEPLAMSTEYYHVGGQGQMGKGKVKPFGTLSIGATRFALKESYGELQTVTELKMSVALSAWVILRPGGGGKGTGS